MSRPKKAVIPAAGRGTRMRPLSEVVPKELFPLGTRPAIEWSIEEARSAGLDEIAVVVSDEKDLLRQYLTDVYATDRPGVSFTFIDQDEPLGLADAIDRCREWVSGEPFGLLLPDNVLLSPEHRYSDMVELYTRTGEDVLGMLELTHADSGRYSHCGLMDYEEVEPRVLRLHKLYDKQKRKLEIAPGRVVRRMCGRYVCHPRIFEAFDVIRPRVEGEFDEVPVYQYLIERHAIHGWLLSSPHFDVGIEEGYLAACAAYRDLRG